MASLALTSFRTVPSPLAQSASRAYITQLKQGIWLYFFLLIFEGALRKWVLPGLATPLLIVRDPLALWLIYRACNRGLFAGNGYLLLSIITSALGFFTALVWGHGNVVVAVYGLRIMLIHFPLIFLIGQIFSRQDVLKVGKMVLMLALPMTLLMAVQFYSPQSAWVNRGLGGDTEGAGFSGALGFFRPPGTFSFITGLASFYGLLAAYVLYFWLEEKPSVKRPLLIAATACLILAIPLSISRTVLFETVLSVLFALVIAASKPKYTGKILGAAFGTVCLLGLLSTLPVFQTGIEAFTSRFDEASDVEGGLKGTLVDRFLGGMGSAISEGEHLPFWGMGLGMGTNAGAKLMTGKTDFLVSEGEWGRIIGEMGLLLGLITIFIRVHFTWKLSWQAFALIAQGNFLPWMLLSFAFVNVIQGQWAQPTSLGFSTLVAGLILAASRSTIKPKL